MFLFHADHLGNLTVPVFTVLNYHYVVEMYWLYWFNRNNWVFPKWLSLNSANSVNHDKIQEQYGCQRHSISVNRYISRCSGKKEFSSTIYLVRVVSFNRYLPRGSNDSTLYITVTCNVFVARWVIHLATIPLLDFVMIHWIHWIH